MPASVQLEVLIEDSRIFPEERVNDNAAGFLYDEVIRGQREADVSRLHGENQLLRLLRVDLQGDQLHSIDK